MDQAAQLLRLDKVTLAAQLLAELHRSHTLPQAVAERTQLVEVLSLQVQAVLAVLVFQILIRVQL
jgi:hypothetical protein